MALAALALVLALALHAPLASAASSSTGSQGEVMNDDQEDSVPISSEDEAPACSDEEAASNLKLSSEPVYAICNRVVLDFGTCESDCMDSFAHVEESAVSCLADGNVLPDQAGDYAAKCEAVQKNNTDWYTPVKNPDAATCGPSVTSSWDRIYGPEVRKYTTCYTADGGCTDECVTFFENAVKEAPACLTRREGNYTFQEYQKYSLARCLRARGKGMENTVLKLDDSADYSAGHHSVGAVGAAVAAATLSFLITMVL